MCVCPALMWLMTHVRRCHDPCPQRLVILSIHHNLYVVVQPPQTEFKNKQKKKNTHQHYCRFKSLNKNTVTFRYVHTSRNNAGDKIFSCIFPTLRNHSRNALGRNTLEIQERKDALMVRRHCVLQSAQRSFSVHTSGPKAPKHWVMIIWRAGMRTD